MIAGMCLVAKIATKKALTALADKRKEIDFSKVATVAASGHVLRVTAGAKGAIYSTHD